MKKVASFLLIALLLSFLVWGGEELFLSPTFVVLMVLDLIFAGIVIGLKNTPAWRIGLICLLTLLALTFLGDWLGPQALENLSWTPLIRQGRVMALILLPFCLVLGDSSLKEKEKGWIFSSGILTSLLLVLCLKGLGSTEYGLGPFCQSRSLGADILVKEGQMQTEHYSFYHRRNLLMMEAKPYKRILWTKRSSSISHLKIDAL